MLWFMASAFRTQASTHTDTNTHSFCIITGSIMESSFTRVQQGTTASMATGKGKISQANGGILSELFLTVFDVFEPSHPRSPNNFSRSLGERKESSRPHSIFILGRP